MVGNGERGGFGVEVFSAGVLSASSASSESSVLDGLEFFNVGVRCVE